jgi:hypothetical protein
MSLVGAKSLQQRLTYACIPLMILRNPAQQVPPNIRKELNEILDQLTVEPLSDASGWRRVARQRLEKSGRRFACRRPLPNLASGSK